LPLLTFQPSYHRRLEFSDLVLLPNRKLEQDKMYKFLQENLRSVQAICAVSCGMVGKPALSQGFKQTTNSTTEKCHSVFRLLLLILGKVKPVYLSDTCTDSETFTKLDRS